MVDIRTDAVNSLPEPLTNREREILTCLVEGLSNQEIAERLHLALRTVKWYNSQIYSKLGVSNRREARARATDELALLVTASTASDTPTKHNLPPQSTSFVGRQRELAAISALLTDPNQRLVTILAPGGMGKTRLALEVARAQIGHFVDGVFFMPLAPLSSASDIVTAIAEQIGFSFYGEHTPVQQLTHFLRDRSLLLVLDNFEHLLDSAPLVADMVRVAPRLRVLATSHERLNLQGETVYVLRGLNFPDWQSPQPIETHDAVKLFLQTAQRVHPGFELQTEDLMHMVLICHLTAGMPLALELAAGWLDILSLERIAGEIQHGIDILETALRDLPERHRSIRATFERTWSRLSTDEQAIFGKLSVFCGGFSLAAAQAVAGANSRHLRGLAQKALIQIEGNERFAIHGLLRQFGADKLAETSELLTIQARHAAFFADCMQVRRGEIFTDQQLDVLDQIGADYENIRAAWNVLVERQTFDELPKFLDGLWFFLHVHSRSQESIELFEATVKLLQSLPKSDMTELAIARLQAYLTWCYHDIGLSEKGIVTGEVAIGLFDQQDSPEERLVVYGGLAVIYRYRWDHENTHKFAQKSYELALKLGDRYWEAHSLLIYSQVARMFSNNRESILRPLRQARAIYEHMQNPWGLMLSYSTEAGNALAAGDYEQVKHWSAQCQNLAKAFGNAFFSGTSALYLGMVAMQQEKDGQAWDSMCQALRTFWDAGLAHFVPGPMVNMARIFLHENKAEIAVEILVLTERNPGYHGIGALFEIGPDRFEKLRQELKIRLGPDRFAAACERGKSLDLDKVVEQLVAEYAP